MGISISGDAAQTQTPKHLAFKQKADKQLQEVLSGILSALAEAAAGRDGDFERTTWHLHMALNYLKLAASETGVAEADAVDAVRERLVDRLFLLEAALFSVGRGGAISRAQGLLEGLELMVAMSSLLPPDPAPSEAVPPE